MEIVWAFVWHNNDPDAEWAWVWTAEFFVDGQHVFTLDVHKDVPRAAMLALLEGAK